PWADNDADSTNWKKPIDGANDGASGVAVIIEIARLLAQDTTINIGVDFVFFDAEDWGTPQWSDSNDGENTWALGSQHFAKNLPPNFQPQFGILLDIVGGQGAKFYREGISMQFAPQIVKKVWRAARKAGYGSYFPDQDGGMVTDDHLPLNQIAGIPTIDIIAYYPDCQQSSFGHTWHTLNDNINFIDKNTLKAVGQTVMQVIAEE
ncbi:MAG: M28 family peptidase, partial [Prevotella sp.]|nr:M28 family peptidase [Prevotella sp.]